MLAMFSGECSEREPAIRLLNVIDLGGNLCSGARRSSVTRRGHHGFRDVPNRLSVGVHRGNDRATGVAVQEDAAGSLPCGIHHNAGTSPASTSAYSDRLRLAGGQCRFSRCPIRARSRPGFDTRALMDAYRSS